MPDTQAMIGYNSRFYLGASSSASTTFTELAEIFNITPPSASVDMIDATHMQSPDSRREFIAGLTDPGECSFEMNYIPGSASDELLSELLDLAPSLRSRRCRIVYPNGASHTFLGVLMTYEPTVPTDDKMTASVSFRVSGAVTRENSSSPTL